MYWEEHIIIIPLMAKKIWIYSLKHRTWKGIAIDVCEMTNFRQAIIWNNFLLLIGGHYPAILKVDLNSYVIWKIEAPFDEQKRIDVESNELYFRGDFVYKDNILYLASCRDNTVLIFHLDTQAYEWIEIGRRENRYSGIAWDGEYFWLAPRKNTSIVKWDGKNQVIEYEIPLAKKVNGISYSGVIVKENQIIIPALYGGNADSIILNNDGIMKFDDKKYTFYKKVDKEGYLAQNSDGKIIFENNKGEQSRYECNILIDDLLTLLNNTKADHITKKIANEKIFFSLPDFLELLNGVDIQTISRKPNGEKKIWNTIILME